MSLYILVGSSGSGKSHCVYTGIIRESMERPDDRFLVIVPEQYSMLTQRELVRLHPKGGILNIDVLSFARLAYRVFSEIGERTRVLEEIGKSFVLQKIALDHKNEMSVLGRNLEKPGNIAEMKSMISELLLYGIGSEELKSCSDGLHDALLGHKLHDIRIVYDAFLKYLSDRFMTAEEVPDVLAREAGRSEILRNSVLIFDGFTGFTPVQLSLIERLLPICREMYVTVTMDPVGNVLGGSRGSDLFFMSHEMTRALADLARRAGIAVEPVLIHADEHKGRFAASPSLAFLERNLFRRKRGRWMEDTSDVSVFAARNPLAEVSHAAESISRMVREEGMRYRDFAIVTGDLQVYDDYVRQVFGEMGIPYFLDEKRSLLHNPFVEYVRAAVEACTENYSYESIFRMLKSGMTQIAAADIDRLENHVLALGIRGKRKWRTKWVTHSRLEDPEILPELNEIRERVCGLLDPMADAFAARESTVRLKTEALYDFCVRSGCERRLAGDAERFSGKGRPDLTREYRQVYARVMKFLDKLVEVLGDEKISMRDYRAILEAGFLEEKIGIIPPGTDQVMVGDMERSRLADIRVLFFLGVNEGMVPKRAGGGGILTEMERERLLLRKIRLKPTSRENISIGKFYIYLALTRPSDKLILSYAASNSGGEVMRQSYLIDAVLSLYPKLKIGTESERIADRIVRPESGIPPLAEQVARLRDQPVEPGAIELFVWYRNHPDYRGRVEKLLSAASARKPQDQIGKAAARVLYGERLVNSASRLERFSACAFAHFLQYGLRLTEREEYEFSGIDMGNIIHSALERFGRITQKLTDGDGTPVTWADMDDKMRDDLAKRCVMDAAMSYNPALLGDSARNTYQIRRMQRLVTTSVWALQQQLLRGDFMPAGFEVDFRDVSDLSSVSMELPDGAAMTLTGRIDRLDTFTEDGKTYVKIMDYKTGSMGFDMCAVYYGLQLQLVVYLNAAMEICGRNGLLAEPAGIFYYRIQDPIEDFEAGDTTESIRRRILKDMKASGIVSGEAEVIAHLDKTLALGEKTSEVIPVELKKDGSLSARSRTVDGDGFRLISSYVNKKILRIGARIMEGRAEINPYAYDGMDACAYCPYRAVCGFDPKIGGYGFRKLLKMKNEEVLLKMEDMDDAMDT